MKLSKNSPMAVDCNQNKFRTIFAGVSLTKSKISTRPPTLRTSHRSALYDEPRASHRRHGVVKVVAKRYSISICDNRKSGKVYKQAINSVDAGADLPLPFPRPQGWRKHPRHRTSTSICEADETSAGAPTTTRLRVRPRKRRQGEYAPRRDPGPRRRRF